MAETRRTALDRLQGLPAMFRMQELSRLTGWSSGVASVMVHRWERDGLVERTGPRGELVVNRFATDSPNYDVRRAAIARAWPSAIEIGAGPIHRAGWSDQIPRVTDIAVHRSPTRRDAGELGGMGIRLQRRPASWYEAVRGSLREDGPLVSLRPAWALADSVLDGHMWAPFPDELAAEGERDRVAAEFATAARMIAIARRLGLAEHLPPANAKGSLREHYEAVWLATRGAGSEAVLRARPRKADHGPGM